MVRVSLAVVLAGALLLPAAGSARPRVSHGNASWYGPSHEGRRMASGCRFRTNRLTAASRTLPLGTWVMVRNERNRRSVVVQITDRGPFIPGRVIDLSRAAARQLNSIKAGILPVSVTVLPLPFTLYCR